MSEAVKWDGFPVFGRDRDAWHLLNYDRGEHPVPMWWNWRGECWSPSPDAAFGTHARDADFSGYSYLAGTVTPADLKNAIAEAVAAERERCLRIVMREGITPAIPDDPDPVAESINAALQNVHEAIRSAAKRHILEAEARGAAEERGKKAEFGLRPISSAKKDRTIILAKIHDDLFPRIRPERKDLEPWNGRWVVVSHPGILEDGFDLGWGVAAPVGHGGFPDDWFVGWKPLEYSANVAALEARIAELETANLTLHGLLARAQDNVPDCYDGWHRDARAALKREGGV